MPEHYMRVPSSNEMDIVSEWISVARCMGQHEQVPSSNEMDIASEIHYQDPRGRMCSRVVPSSNEMDIVSEPVRPRIKGRISGAVPSSNEMDIASEFGQFLIIEVGGIRFRRARVSSSNEISIASEDGNRFRVFHFYCAGALLEPQDSPSSHPLTR